MHILIADDTQDVVRNFAKAITKLGHNAIVCNSLKEACKVMDDPGRHVDIAFVDNHFHGEDYGIDKVRDFITKKPDTDIVITTKRDVRPDLVADLVNLRVGFFKKQSDDPTLLEAEISQRVNIHRSKDEALQRRIGDLQRAASGGSEGVRRFLDFFTGSSAKRKPIVELIEPMSQHMIVPRFERIYTIQVGQHVDITEEYELEYSQHWKAATSMELGLGIDESVKFFSSKLGIQVRQKVQNLVSLDETIKLKSSYKIGQKLSLTPEDASRQIRRREYYRGVNHELYKVVIRSSCGHCGTTDSVDLRVFVPVDIVEVCVAFDKKGFKVPGEDGREAYYQLRL